MKIWFTCILFAVLLTLMPGIVSAHGAHNRHASSTGAVDLAKKSHSTSAINTQNQQDVKGDNRTPIHVSTATHDPYSHSDNTRHTTQEENNDCCHHCETFYVEFEEISNTEPNKKKESLSTHTSPVLQAWKRPQHDVYIHPSFPIAPVQGVLRYRVLLI